MRLEHASGAFTALTGYDRDELASMEPVEMADCILHEDDRDSVLAYHRKLLAGEEVPLHIEYRIVRKDGAVRWLEETAEPMNEGEATVRAFIIDVTDRLEAEERMERERRQLLSIFEGLDEYVYVADPDTYEILFANESLRRVFGNIEGRKCYEALQGKDAPCPFCTNDRIFGENEGRSYVWEFRNKNDRRWYRCIDKAIEWPDGRRVRAEIALDIHDLKTAEERLKASEARYRSIFEGAAVSLWELDFGAFRDWVRRLRDRGISDVAQYCSERPEAVADICRTMRIVDANRESLRLFAVPTRADLPDSVASFATPESTDFICGLAQAVAERRSCYRAATVLRTLHGEKLDVMMTATLERGSRTSFVSMTDVTGLKRVERALRESEEHYREVVENAHEAIIVIQDGLIAFVNPKGAEAIGKSVDEMIGTPFLEFVHPEERELLRKRHEDRLAGRDVPQSYTYRSIAPDDRVVWGEVHATPITWDGRPATLNFVADVTERKEAEEARLEALADKASIMDAMADGLVVVSQDGTILDANPAMATLLGVEPTELIGHTARELARRFVAADHVDTALEGFRDSVAGRVPPAYLLPVVTSSGEEIPVTFQISALGGGETERLLVSFHDMRQILSIEHALRTSEEERRLFMESATESFTLWDEDLRLVDANKAACEILGRPRDELVGLSLHEVYPPLDEETVAKYRRVIETGDAYEAYDVEPPGDAAERRYAVKAFPAGSGLGMIVTDTTDRWKAQEALRRSEEHYRQVVENADEAIVVAQDGKLRFFNQRLADILGYDDEDLRAMPFTELIHPEDRELVAERHRLRLSGEDPESQYGFRVLTRDGETRFVRINAVRFEWGNRPATLNFISDITEQVRNERAIRDRTQRLRLLFERANDAILVMSGERFIDCNERALDMFGCSREDIVGKSPYALSPAVQPDGRSSREKALEKLSAVTEGEPQSFEWTHQRIDGTAFDAEVGLTAFTLDGEKYIQAFVRDITKRKRAEESVRSIARFPAENPNPVIRVLRDGRIVYANEATDWLLEQWGCEVGHYVPPELRQTITLAFQKGCPDRFEMAFGDRTYSFVLAPVVDSGYINIYGQDVTELKQSEMLQSVLFQISESLNDAADLKELLDTIREKLGLLLDTTNFYVALYDQETDTYTFPCHFDEQDEIDDVTPIELKHSLTDYVRRTGLPLLIDNEKHAELQDDGEVDLVGTDSPIWLGVPLRTRQEVFGVVAVQRYDQASVYTERHLEVMTFVSGTIAAAIERMRAQEERRELEEQMRHAQKLESLGVLAGGIAHDFNNLLTGIMGNADLALMTAAEETSVGKSLKEIKKSAERAAELSRQMLAYSGRGNFVIEPIDLNDVLAEMSNLLEVSISKKATLRCDLAGGLPSVVGDATQVRQVIMNLITNASDAIGDAEGIIRLSTGVVECSQSDLAECYAGSELPAGTYAYVEVADSGCGMSEDTLQRIFDPFFTTKFTGRGLGLAAALGIMRGHGGGIRVESEEGRGTVFRILLPTDGSQASSQEAPVVERPTVASEGVVLLVDDEETVRLVGASMLEQSGFSVVTAADGSEAVDYFREHQDEIGCVLLDLTMPRMDGRETFDELRRIRSDVRVVLSSGYSEQEVYGRFAGQGIAGFVQKPYLMDRLVGEVQRAMSDGTAVH
jgi:PAS domain S-box-containing protein